MPVGALGNETPLATVILIVYNQQEFVKRALESILAQECSFPVEVVIGDDCSTDGSTEALREVTSSYTGAFSIRELPRNENLGMHRNFYECLLASKGRFVALLEGDDYWVDEKKLDEQVRELLATGCAFSGHPTVLVDEVGKRVGEIPPRPFPIRLSGKAFIEEGCYVHTSSVVFRRDYLSTLPEYVLDQRNRCLDVSLEQLLALSGDLAFIPRTMSVYRKHYGGANGYFARRRGTWEKAMIFATREFNRYTGGNYSLKLRYLIALRYASLGRRESTQNPILRLWYKLLAVFYWRRRLVGALLGRG